MRQTVLHRHALGIERVVAHLRERIEPPHASLPDLEELAAIAHLSPFHFHRIYRALTGETVGHTVARLRLSVALRRLGEGASVTEAAMAAGYDSPQALARVFRARLDVTPASLRGDAYAVTPLLQRLAGPDVAVRDAAASPLRVTVQDVAPFEVVVLRQRGAFEDLDRGFGRLFGWAMQAGLGERLERLVGVPLVDHRDVAPREHLFDCAMAFGDGLAMPPAPMSLRTLGGGEHAVLRHVGPYEGLEDALDRLLAEWWPGSGRELRDAPVFHHYLDDPEEVPAPILRADLYVPLAP
ncbi:AraC family transcriptional regulator [Stenotrophomonas panacihumi]|uniref:AraC family transcriptional regulator n=1 Tax=Stenotrophomonas panacihumi TaxID=676599 RepID=A0A0R0A726_9GAMM|nr:GyrI-like domain-containing protein [Stenotrophomonas panacihumi]KRG40741.1 AraC family transcriptional regulator [Stenotrophomonas panacihumi]PTN54818.1 AraC family transcriptional regulator [Stenotrophomonas panacihumi]